MPEEEWQNAIRLTFNAKTRQVQAEQGLFAPGDNAYVDEEIFAHDDTVKSVKATNSLDEEKDFDVTPLTQDILDKRAY